MTKDANPRPPLKLGRAKGKFPLGRLVATPGALDVVPIEEMTIALKRHLAGDWGDLDEHDRRENEFALGRALRLFSVYRTRTGAKFWIVTEADRSATTVLLPNEY